MRNFLFFILILLCPGLLIAQGYSDHAKQTARLQALAKANPQFAKLKSLTKTAGGKDIWALTIGSGKMDDKPAIAIVGGVEGSHVLGTELAIGFAESILSGTGTDSIKALLDKTTFYVFPNMSPDAMEQYFASLKYERQGNAVATDDDRDGKTNEDGFDDLDGNDKITWMRVESPIGEYKSHPDDPRVLVKADLSKGEKGKYLLYAEGMDNDKDGQFNEDGEGGVQFNKNFTYKHPSFTPGSGEMPASEVETRALVDFLFERFNIYAVLSFGSNNNLSTPVTFNPLAVSQTIITGWLEADTKVNAMVSDLYNKTTGYKDAPKAGSTGGDFLSWAYFHYARFSFSTPGWWVPKTKPDSTKNEKAFTLDDAGANFLRWSGQQGLSDVFTEWKPVEHPDFPGQKVEVGGLQPFGMNNPPYKLVPDIIKKNSSFILKLASYQPQLELADLKTEKLGNGLTRITLDVMNKGAFASHSKLGERSYWVKRVNVKLNTSGNQTVVSGRKNQVLNALDGYSSQTLTWLVKGSGKLTIEAGSPTTGSKTIDVTL
ncbi:MAG TPA: M14 family metallopeptidase [Chitinophagaceae bacterium]|nr:M14 family metallopeptidase [Chitinophagaceae bacterium]